MNFELEGKWLSSRWQASKAPYSAVNHILRMYYDSSNASVVSAWKGVGNTVDDIVLLNAGFEVDHFIGIQFVANYIVRKYDFRDLQTGQLQLLSEHLNHPFNLYRVNKDFNQKIGKLKLENFSNCSSRDPSITRYLKCEVTRKHVNKDQEMLPEMVHDGTVASNVQYLLNSMRAATGKHSDLTVEVGKAFSAYLSLVIFRDPPTTSETFKIGGSIEKGLQ